MRRVCPQASVDPHFNSKRGLFPKMWFQARGLLERYNVHLVASQFGELVIYHHVHLLCFNTVIFNQEVYVDLQCMVLWSNSPVICFCCYRMHYGSKDLCGKLLYSTTFVMSLGMIWAFLLTICNIFCLNLVLSEHKYLPCLFLTLVFLYLYMIIICHLWVIVATL